MNLIDFTQSGGYRFKQPTLSKMQESYYHILAAFMRFVKTAPTGNYIISGCEISGGNIAEGYLLIDNELCLFAGAVGDGTTKIKKEVVIESLAFENGSNPPVFRSVRAIVDAAGIALEDFEPIDIVLDANYVHTDNNFTAVLLAKLNGIEAEAEKNVQTDWNIANPLSDAYLKNRPVIENILYSGEYLLGDFPNARSQRKTIPFPVALSTTNYKVRCYTKSLNPLNQQGQDLIIFSTTNYQQTSFDIIGGELGFFGASSIQNLHLFYEIIAL